MIPDNYTLASNGMRAALQPGQVVRPCVLLGLAMALAMSVAGCLVPAPFQVEDTPPAAPLFLVPAEEQPSFGVVTSPTREQPKVFFSILLNADTRATLTAHWFVAYSQGNTQIAHESILTPEVQPGQEEQGTAQTSVRPPLSFEFAPCNAPGIPAGPNIVTVVVSDQGFADDAPDSMTVNKTLPEGAQQAVANWYVDCPDK
jgi:hypothetical protein